MWLLHNINLAKKSLTYTIQGRKPFTPQLFYQTSLENLVPEDNFYRKVNQALDLHFFVQVNSAVLWPKEAREHRSCCFL